MKMIWTLFQVRGIPIRAHLSLLLAIPYFAVVIAVQLPAMAELAGYEAMDLTLSPFAWGGLLSIGLFVCVGLHELAHALYAMVMGRKVRGITLMLLGGISHIEEDEKGKGEAGIAAIGPFSSLILTVLFYGLSNALSASPDASFGLFYLAQINMMLAVFNMIPAFPLDGGRVLRALLARPFGRERATRIAVSAGKGVAIAMGLFGLFTVNFILMLIAIFIYSAGTLELRLQLIRSRLGGLSAADLLPAHTYAVAPTTTVGLVLEELARRKLSFVPVVQVSGKIHGVALLGQLQRVPEGRRSEFPVGLAVDKDVPMLRPQDSAERVLDLILERSFAAIVEEDGKFNGMIEKKDIARALSRRLPIGKDEAA